MLATKVRPHSFDGVVGQRAVVENLRNQSIREKFFQGYTLCGQFGSGKTTLARILSLALNCEHKDESGNPCLECESCKAILGGQASDIMEIDAASNTGVDNIRALKEDVRFVPSQLKKKVYIIDEVQRLSSGAFDALLKVLEEPPSHVAFILCTTEKNKIPKTILSRTAVYQFGCINVEDITSHLERVAEEEGYDFEVAALELIAKNSQGAMRNALSLLEQVAGAGDVTEDNVASMLGIADSGKIASFLDMVLAMDRKGAVQEVVSLLNGGLDPYCMLSDCLDFLADAILCAYGQSAVGGTKEYGELVLSIAKKYSPSDFSRAIKGFTELRQQVRAVPEHTTMVCGIVMMLTEDSDVRIARLERELENIKSGGFIVSDSNPSKDSIQKADMEDVSDFPSEEEDLTEDSLEEETSTVCDKAVSAGVSTVAEDGWSAAGEEVAELFADAPVQEETVSEESVEAGQDKPEYPEIGSVYINGGSRFRVEEISERADGSAEVSLLDLTLLEQANYPIHRVESLEFFWQSFVLEESVNSESVPKEDEPVENISKEQKTEEKKESFQPEVSKKETPKKKSNAASGWDLFNLFHGGGSSVPVASVKEAKEDEPVENVSKEQKICSVDTAGQRRELDDAKSSDPLLESIVDMSCDVQETEGGVVVRCKEGVTDPVGRMLQAYVSAGKIPVPVTFS